MRPWIYLALLCVAAPLHADWQEDWQKSLQKASQLLPKLADLSNPDSALSRLTEEVRREYIQSSDPEHRRIADEGDAVVIASEALSRLTALNAARTSISKAWDEALMNASRTFPSLADPESELSRQTELVRQEYVRSDNEEHLDTINRDDALTIVKEAYLRLNNPPLEAESSLKIMTEVQPSARLPEASESWAAAIRGASTSFPSLTDSNSELRVMTEKVRIEYSQSKDPVQKMAVNEDAALYIATEANSRLALEAKLKVDESWHQIGVKYPDSKDEKSQISLYAKSIFEDWITSNNPLTKSSDCWMKAFDAAHALIKLKNSQSASEQAVIAKYPDATDPTSSISIKAQEIVAAWIADDNQNLYSPNAPMIVYDKAHSLMFPPVSPEKLKEAWDDIDQSVGSKHPEARTPGSEINIIAQKVVKEWTASQDARLFTSNAPALVYDEAALRLHEKTRKTNQELTLEIAQLKRDLASTEYMRDFEARWGERWKEMAQQQERVIIQNGSVESNRAYDYQTVPSHPKSHRPSHSATIINTAPGHWQTSEGGVMIEAAPGHYIYSE